MPRKKKEPELLKLNLASGAARMDGFINVDIRKEVKPDVIFDLASDKRWPWKDESVEFVRCGHFFHLLASEQRIHFLNELWRVLKTNHPFNAQGAKAEIVTPHWASASAYVHPHSKTPVSEASYAITNKKWRKDNDYDYFGINSNFRFMPGYGAIHPDYTGRNEEFLFDKLNHCTNAASELWMNLFKMPSNLLE